MTNDLSTKKDRNRMSNKITTDILADFNLSMIEESSNALSDNSNHNNNHNNNSLEEGKCKIEGVAVLGLSAPNNKNMSSADKYHNLNAGSGETITMMFPLDNASVSDPNEINNNKRSSMSKADFSSSKTSNQELWSLPLPNADKTNKSNLPSMQTNITVSPDVIQNNEKLPLILERMLCQHSSYEQYNHHLFESLKVALASEDDENNGPKSIAQVRKEREKLNMINENLNMQTSISQNGINELNDAFQDVSLDEGDDVSFSSNNNINDNNDNKENSSVNGSTKIMAIDPVINKISQLKNKTHFFWRLNQRSLPL
jgi:hypothetical protein